jgi:hypothetical protein
MNDWSLAIESGGRGSRIVFDGKVCSGFASDVHEGILDTLNLQNMPDIGGSCPSEEASCDGLPTEFCEHSTDVDSLASGILFDSRYSIRITDGELFHKQRVVNAGVEGDGD